MSIGIADLSNKSDYQNESRKPIAAFCVIYIANGLTMGFFRFIKYKYLISNRRKRYASLAISLALAHASFAQVRYKSVGNGLADITLALRGDHEFMLDFQSFDTEKNTVMKGTWTSENNDYVLHFKKVKTDLNALFESNTGFQKIIKIADRRTVRFPKTQAGLFIHGIYCPRYAQSQEA